MMDYMTFEQVLEGIRDHSGSSGEEQPCFAREDWDGRHIRGDGDGTIWLVYGPYASNMMPYKPTSDDMLANDWMEV